MFAAHAPSLAVPTGESVPAAAKMSGIWRLASDLRHPAQDNEGMPFNDDRRAFSRHGVQKDARLLFVDQPCSVECTIREISAGGARLSMLVSVSLPTLFLMWEQRAGAIRECEVRWRQGRTVGVHFTDVYGRSPRRAFVEDGFAQPRRPGPAALLH